MVVLLWLCVVVVLLLWTLPTPHRSTFASAFATAWMSAAFSDSAWRNANHAMNLGLKSLELKGEPTDECKDWRVAAMEGAAQVVESLGTEKVRKNWKAAAEGMAQASWAPEDVVARPLEILMGRMPKWQKSNPEKEGTGVASQLRLNHGKSKCGFPRDAGHHKGEQDDLGKSPSG